MVKLYIADTDPAFIAQVKRALGRGHGVEVVGTARNGRQALRDLLRLRPDVVLTDIPLPELDGIALLREANRLSRAPAVIVCTRFYSGASMEWAYQYGASFFLCKPVDFERLAELVVQCAGSVPMERKDASADGEGSAPSPEALRRLLGELGIPPRLDAAIYLTEAVRSLWENELLLKNLSRGLYAQLADRLDTTAQRVERSLRNGIAVGYERGAMKRVFPRRPTNREFIEYLLNQTRQSGEAPLCI